MIKVPDNLKGHVYMNEVVKGIDYEDASLLAIGAAIAGNILVKAGQI